MVRDGQDAGPLPASCVVEYLTSRISPMRVARLLPGFFAPAVVSIDR